MVASDAWMFAGTGFLAAVHGGESARASIDEVMEYLTLPDTDVNMRAENLATALHYASGSGGVDHAAIVKALLSHNADVTAKDCAGRTPLHWAAANGRTEQLGLLLQAGAEVDAKNAYGSTPLHVACAARASPACMSLVEAGADVNAVNNGGWTPLHYAMRGGEGCNDPALVEWLVRRGGLLEFGISSDSRTPSPSWLTAHSTGRSR